MGQKDLVIHTDICAAAADIAVKSDGAYIVRHIEIGAPGIDKGQVALASGTLQRLSGAGRQNVGPFGDQGSVDIKKEHISITR